MVLNVMKNYLGGKGQGPVCRPFPRENRDTEKEEG